MSLESFYGGRPGVSPIIKEHFDSIAQMDEAFAQTNYTDVWYGEYCIIDAPNRRNPDHGKIFRRSLVNQSDGFQAYSGDEKVKDTAYAEYIGQIVGPAGGFPNVALGSIDGVKDKVEELVKNAFDENNNTLPISGAITYPIEENGSWSYAVKELEDIKSTKASSAEAYANEIVKIKTASKESSQLIPGATFSESNNNTQEQNPNLAYSYNKHEEPNAVEKGVKYAWVNLRKDEDGVAEESFVYLGFQVPFTVFNFNFNSVPWNTKLLKADLVNKNNYLNGSQPFYQSWSIDIPRGTTGDQVRKIRRTTCGEYIQWKKASDVEDSDQYLYNINSTGYDTDGNKNSVVPIDIDNEDLPYKNYTSDTSILVCTINFFNSDTHEEDSKDFLVGTIKDIKDIALADDGTITIEYSDNTSSKTFNKAIKWITNTFFEKIPEDFNKPNGMNINDGELIFFYNDNTYDKHKIPYIKKMDVVHDYQDSQDTSKFSAGERIKAYQAGVNNQNLILFENYKIINDIAIDSDTQEIVYNMYPDNTTLGYDNPKNSKSISQNDGLWYDGNDENITNKYRYFKSKPFLNSIDATYIDPKTGHLYVLYKSSLKREDFRINGGTKEDDVNVESVIEHAIEEGFNPPLYTWNKKDENGKIISKWAWRSSFPEEANNINLKRAWQDLGLVKEDISTLKIDISNEVLVKRYAQVTGNARWSEDPNILSNENNIGDFVTNVLNHSWNVTENTSDTIDFYIEKTITDEQGNTTVQPSFVRKGDFSLENVDFNPYSNGNIYSYSTMNDETHPEVVNNIPIEGVNYIGGILYYSGQLFAYAKEENQWKWVGSLGITASSLGVKPQIVLKNVNNTSLPVGETSKQHFELILENVSNSISNNVPQIQKVWDD